MADRLEMYVQQLCLRNEIAAQDSIDDDREDFDIRVEAVCKLLGFEKREEFYFVVIVDALDFIDEAFPQQAEGEKK